MFPFTHGVLASSSAQAVSTDFIIRIKTDNAGSSASNQFNLNLAIGNYNVSAKNEATNVVEVFENIINNQTLTFSEGAGVYTLNFSVNSASLGFRFNSSGDRLKVLEIVNWGIFTLASPSNLRGCANMVISATDQPNFAPNFNAEWFLGGCTSLKDSTGNFEWDATNLKNCSTFLRDATGFNLPIIFNNFKPTNIFQFFNATSFNQNSISNWDLTECTAAGWVFRPSPFNQLVNWNLRLSGVTLDRVFESSGMSTANYTDTIVYWANYAFDNAGTPINVNMSSQGGRTFTNSRSGGANFANAGAARTYLTTTLGWTISGDTVI